MADIPSWARVGAKVVCVDVHTDYRALNGVYSNITPAAALSEGTVYTIACLGTGPFNGAPLVLLAEVPLRSAADRGYDVRRFRPLVTEADDVALFQRLVADMPVSERLDRLAEKLNMSRDRLAEKIEEATR